MKTLIRTLSAAVFWSVSPAWAQTYTVVGVTDGDTVKVLSVENRQIKCRLYGIDAPEKNQAFGQKSKQSLSDLVYQRSVEVEIIDYDRYGRSVCRISANGIDVNREQIARGMAWMYRRYASDPLYSQAEASAKLRHFGLWSDSNPVPPWNFRRGGNQVLKE